MVTEDDPGFGPTEDEFRVGCDGQQPDEFHGCGLALRRAVVRLDKLTVADAVDDEIHGCQAAAIDERLLGVGYRKVEMAIEIGWRHGCRVPDFQPTGYGRMIDCTGRCPFGDEVSLATAGDDPTASAEAPSSARPNTPIGMNSQASVARGRASPDACASDALTTAARAAVRQLNTRFAFTP